MNIYPTERTAVFIDGANLWGTMRDLKWELDYKQLYEYFGKRGQLLRCYYYTALQEGTHGPLNRLCEMLSHNGYSIVTKNVKTNVDYSTGESVRKGNMDIEIAVDMLRLAPNLDHLVLASGDGDFRYVVQAVQDMGKRVSVLSTEANGIKVLAPELARQADHFIEIESLRAIVALRGQDRATAINASLKTKAPANVG